MKKKPNRYWTKERINEEFYDTINRLRRIPTSKEFDGSALGEIIKREYDPEIRTWNEFLRYHGLEVNRNGGRYGSHISLLEEVLRS